jgi:hypothetical protein
MYVAGGTGKIAALRHPDTGIPIPITTRPGQRAYVRRPYTTPDKPPHIVPANTVTGPALLTVQTLDTTLNRLWNLGWMTPDDIRRTRFEVDLPFVPHDLPDHGKPWTFTPAFGQPVTFIPDKIEYERQVATGAVMVHIEGPIA